MYVLYVRRFFLHQGASKLRRRKTPNVVAVLNKQTDLTVGNADKGPALLLGQSWSSAFYWAIGHGYMPTEIPLHWRG